MKRQVGNVVAERLASGNVKLSLLGGHAPEGRVLLLVIDQVDVADAATALSAFGGEPIRETPPPELLEASALILCALIVKPRNSPPDTLERSAGEAVRAAAELIRLAGERR